MKPMLAAKLKSDADLALLRFPMLGSPKLDGIRAVVDETTVLSRTLKPIPNSHVQQWFGKKHLHRLDGELIVGLPTSSTVYRDTVSGVMGDNGDAGTKFFVFDFVDESMPFLKRQDYARKLCEGESRIQFLESSVIENLKQMTEFEERCLDVGFEGIMLRSMDGRYKFGRSTLKEQGLVKIKRFLDDEAKIIGFEEEMHNGNEAEVNELGRTKRSSAKAGKSGKGTLGAWIVQNKFGTFNVGSGMTAAERADFWTRREQMVGQTIKYKYFPIGMKDVPRHPIYLGLRPEGA